MIIENQINGLKQEVDLIRVKRLKDEQVVKEDKA
jgi:hypothetical protein